MDLSLSDDEHLLSAALEKVVADHSEPPLAPAAFHLSDRLEAVVREAGYLQVCDELGSVGAVLVIEALARTPFAFEAAGRALVAPMALNRALAEPLAIYDATGPGPVRFLAPGAALLVVRDDGVGLVDAVDAAAPVESLFAYPYGRLEADLIATARPLDGVSPEAVRLWRRIGISAEAVGAMRAALQLTARYVADRHQFGRPIGSYQAVQHRLAECACLVDGAWLMTLRAAASGSEVDALLTLAFVQRALGRLVEETNQLHGAIGLTLEYPLHYWSYRMRALQGELGGPARQATLAAARVWPADTLGSQP